MRVPRKALTIAGSDSGGCAGIQADLKTFAALGVHGSCVITSVTAQDTRRVHASFDLSAEAVEHQIRAVLSDIGADAVKTGMLWSGRIVSKVADLLKEFNLKAVVDPVMVSTGGDQLLRSDALAVLQERLLPLACVVTPNWKEAEALAGIRIGTLPELKEAAGRILKFGSDTVLIKGGHGPESDQSTDYLFGREGYQTFSAPRLGNPNTHGSGCTLSAAIAAHLALGHSLPEAVSRAKDYTTEAIRHGYSVGQGAGPLHQLFQLRSMES